MIKSFKIAALVLFVFASMGFVACSDDNDGPDPTPDSVVSKQDPNPASVFPYGIPKSIGIFKLMTNNKGWVTLIKSEDLTVLFDYTGSTEATKSTKSTETSSSSIPKTYDMMMLMDDYNNNAKYYITLNKQGYVEYAYEELEGAFFDEMEITEWYFKYNNAGQLTEFTESTKGYEDNVTILSYNSAGDLTTIIDTLWDSNKEISYTDEKTPTPIPNKSGIILLENCYRISTQYSSLNYMAMAGLLGKSSTHLPIVLISGGGNYTQRNNWTLDASDMPISFYYDYKGRDIGSGMSSDMLIEW